MDSLLKQKRERFSSPGRDYKLEDDDHFATAIAAASFAIHSLEEAELQYQKRLGENLRTSRTNTKTSRKDDMQSSGAATRRLSNKEAKHSAGESSPRRPVGLDHKASESAFQSRNPSRTSPVRGDRYQNRKGIIAGNTGVTKAEAWEKTQMEKIKNRYEKLKSTILAWENEKKMRAKIMSERTKSTLEQRMTANQKHYQNKIARIDEIARGARAQIEEKRRNKESDVKEKAKKIRSTGNVPVTFSLLTLCLNPANPHFWSRSKYGVAELTWENGQVAMHELAAGLVPTATATAKPQPTWVRTGDTLESLVRQATFQSHYPNAIHYNPTQMTRPKTTSSTSMVGSSSHLSHQHQQEVPNLPKRTRICESKNFSTCSSINNNTKSMKGFNCRSTGSGATTICRDSDATMLTWASFESDPHSLKKNRNKTTTTTAYEDSAYHGGLMENQGEDRETKGESAGARSNSTRRSRFAAAHNQSERRRRDRINQKMKALQKLVPNASKTDKASMLDEVIEYLKLLQAQIQMMSSVRNTMPQMIMPLGMQHHLQMSLLARMASSMGVGLGMGMGMLDMTAMARAASQSLPRPLVHHSQVAATHPTFVPPPFMVPPILNPAANTPAQAKIEPAGTSSSLPLPDPYCAFLAQYSTANKPIRAHNQSQAIHPGQAICKRNKKQHFIGKGSEKIGFQKDLKDGRNLYF
ncbi:hypothetical protein FNV43_RR20339 [Rhamnella rubrinervis]|uniref:BHLH domain-containing protein n=1 Tax=Rhamnella rubrinervis TaxID=2594499 RepID=A0A8K0E068_9ROSA|nr:hypothetical protein FNV43_RR20339 [Rhamnella rubrinervis]